MEEVFLRTQGNERYNENLYSQWNHLPPNLPLPSSSTVQVFSLTFDKLLYLHQISQQTPYQFKISWWGMQKPQSLTMRSQNISVSGKYVLCCSVEGLLSYFTDMKVVSVDVSSKNKSVGKAYLNFLMLKGWRGQKYEGFMDIKLDKKKIGEITYNIEIYDSPHPFLNVNTPLANLASGGYLAVSQATKKSIKQNSSNKLGFNGREHSPKHSIADSISNSQNHEQDEISERLEDNGPFPTRKTLQQKALNPPRKAPQIDLKKYELQRQMMVFESHNTSNYQAEMVRLAEDFNFLFQNRQKSNQYENNLDNLIEIQIVKIDLPFKEKKNVENQIQVILPLISNKKNQYRLGPGGFIKVYIENKGREDIIEYLKNTVIQFKHQSNVEGNMKLSKILSKSGEVIQIPLFEKEKKQKQRGSCFVKAVPPPKQQQKEQKSIEEKPDKEIITQPDKIKQKSLSYVLFSFKNYNSLEPLTRKVNLYIKIFEQGNQQSIGQSKTLWSCQQQTMKFDDSVTIQTKMKKIYFFLLDRQKSDLKIGEGSILIESPIGIGVEIPIFAKLMGKQRIVGYLSLDFVNNGLNSVTKMINIFGRTQNAALPCADKIQEEKKNEEKSEREVLQSQHSERDPLKEDILYKNLNQILQINDDKIQNIQTAIAESAPKEPKQIIFERNLTDLQIYNKLFTFLHQNQNLMTLLSEKQSIKITEFIQLFQPIITKRILSIKQLNLIISKHIFTERKSVTLIDCAQFKESYDAFSTYYEELVQERDQILKELLSIMERVGISINDLEFGLKNNKKIWDRLNQFLTFSKGEKINILEAVKQHYEHTSGNPLHQRSIVGHQFCDILRRFEVYETTLGEQVIEDKLYTVIYEHLCQLLIEDQPEIFNYTYKELLGYLKEEQIILSQWEMLNLQHFLRLKSQQRQNPYQYYINKQEESFPQSKFNLYRETSQRKKQNLSELTNKPTISKSPTFGFLHAPELLNKEINQNDNNMVESLDIKMTNLPISPINYQNSQSATQQLKVIFSNLVYQLVELLIDDKAIDLQKIHNYYSNNSNQVSSNLQVKKYQSSKNEVVHSQQQQKTVKSVEEPSKDIKKLSSQNGNIEVSISHMEKKFSYKVELYFKEELTPVTLEVIHDQWCSLVSDEGDYIGGILIV